MNVNGPPGLCRKVVGLQGYRYRIQDENNQDGPFQAGFVGKLWRGRGTDTEFKMKHQDGFFQAGCLNERHPYTVDNKDKSIFLCAPN